MMRPTTSLPPDSRVPSRLSVFVWELKLALLRAGRHGLNLARPVPRYTADDGAYGHCVARHVSPLATNLDPRERPLELGKIQNLRAAVRNLNRVVVPAGKIFSFWRQVGKCTRRRGFVLGRQLQEGCLVPAVGGGICQLSNALHDVALQAGFQIVERHRHTRIIPGSTAEQDRDATVAWNHIDLRWIPHVDFQLRALMTSKELVVEVWTANKPPAPSLKVGNTTTLRQTIDAVGHSCGTCHQENCHLFHKGAISAGELVAVLVDEYWPEYDGWQQGESCVLFLPLDGRRWRRPAYRWATAGYRDVVQAVVPALRRAWKSRRLAEQGAERQRARISSNQEIAEYYGRHLKPEMTHLVVCLDLLPHLWLSGHLGGRTFDVLMTRFPLSDVHARLDAAAARHPEQKLLSDFRADPVLVRAEAGALAVAQRLVTPHRAVANQDVRRLQLDWNVPAATGRASDGVAFIVFPGPTVARKGAYAVREVAKQLGLPVMPIGSHLEDFGFWDGIELLPPNLGWVDEKCAVVQPAVLEDHPRTLLLALASGRPVICTEACGVAGMAGVTVVREGEVDAMVLALKSLM